MTKKQLAHTIAALIRRGDKQTAGKLLAELGKNRQRLPTRPPAPIAAGKVPSMAECDKPPLGSERIQQGPWLIGSPAAP